MREGTDYKARPFRFLYPSGRTVWLECQRCYYRVDVLALRSVDDRSDDDRNALGLARGQMRRHLRHRHLRAMMMEGVTP